MKKYKKKQTIYWKCGDSLKEIEKNINIIRINKR